MSSILTYSIRTAILTLYPSFFRTLGRLKRHPLTQHLVLEFGSFRAELDAAMTEELGLTEAEFEIDAAIEFADEDLNRSVDEVAALVLVEAQNDRSAPVFRLYFASQRPSDVKKPLLGSQSDTMRPWPASLKASPNVAMQQAGTLVEARLQVADGCEAEKEAISQKITVFRTVGTRAKLIEKYNALRKRVHGILGEIQHANPSLGADWADSFFREGARSEKVTLSGLDQKIAAAEAQLAALRKQRDELAAQEEAAVQAKAEAERAQKMLALAAKKKAAEELAAQMAELEAELGVKK